MLHPMGQLRIVDLCDDPGQRAADVTEGLAP
jgi:hypothetical protein